MDDILPFKSAEECNGMQLFVVTGIYGYVLFVSAGLIGDGSELLLLVPALADLVGSVVLPVLGAVPDGTMVLFSGLGPREYAQDQVTVGVGALAGSTVMLLTVAWFLGVYGGRVNIRDGKPDYKSTPKLWPPGNSDLKGTGIKIDSSINKNSLVMMGTCLLYGFGQLPALMLPSEDALAATSAQTGTTVFDLKANAVNTFALYGLAACLIAFFGYLYLQTLEPADDPNAGGDDMKKLNATQIAINVQRQRGIQNGEISLRGVMYGLVSESGSHPGAPLLAATDKEKMEMKRVLKPFFEYYDADKSHCLNRIEFAKILHDLHEDIDLDQESSLFNSADVDKSGTIEFNEFVALMLKYVKNGGMDSMHQARMSSTVKGLLNVGTPRETEALVQRAGEEGDSEDEDEMPDDLKGLSPAEQQRAVKTRAFVMMGIGTILVLIFSDPAVDVLNEIGKRTGIPAFYISFVLAPLASNASELVATYKYASKKTPTSMTISLATLEGAACMNNTFCLLIFYALVWQQGLCWDFCAEIIAIVAVQLVVGVYALKSSCTLFDASCILALFPVSLVLVWVLNNIVGMK